MKTPLRWACSLALLPLLLTGCNPPALSNRSLLQANQTGAHDFDFEVMAGFRLASVDDSDKEVIEKARQSFEADLRSGRTTDYQRDEDFSIHLLSGSEGNYFTSSELVQSTVSQVLATLVVVDANQQAQVFKGQYDSPRFVFADPSEQFALSERTKAYLLTADGSFEIQTYKGELVPEDEAESGQTASTESNTDSNTYSSAEGGQSTAQAVETNLDYGQDYGQDYGPEEQPFYPPGRAYPAQPVYNGVNVADGMEGPPPPPPKAVYYGFQSAWEGPAPVWGESRMVQGPGSMPGSMQGPMGPDPNKARLYQSPETDPFLDGAQSGPQPPKPYPTERFAPDKPQPGKPVIGVRRVQQTRTKVLAPPRPALEPYYPGAQEP
ncbi:MAG: hypothetical protein ACAI44_22560 [Candidatus Sericytochromatia bacterium]